MTLHLKTKLLVLSLFCCCAVLQAQENGPGIKIFGYFQVTLSHEKIVMANDESNSFSLQQLNLFLQKDLAQNWTTFVNLEFVNSYSSFRNWGAFSLEEAWVSYRASNQVKFKLGLQVPTFNNLNEIKNRTPLLPYVIRPLAYESSFHELIALEEFLPARAFLQAYGFIPYHKNKIEYAIFLGNSPNINSDPSRGQTGVDTTELFLVGGRFGLRNSNLKLGVSISSDQLDLSTAARSLGYPVSDFTEVPRLRLGGDFSLNLGKFVWESEIIRVTYDDDYPEFNNDKEFYYGTAGYHFVEKFFAYGGYWVTKENFLPQADRDIKAVTAGAVYHFSDAIFAKAQMGRVKFEGTKPILNEDTGYYYFLAVSMIF